MGRKGAEVIKESCIKILKEEGLNKVGWHMIDQENVYLENNYFQFYEKNKK